MGREECGMVVWHIVEDETPEVVNVSTPRLRKAFLGHAGLSYSFHLSCWVIMNWWN